MTNTELLARVIICEDTDSPEITLNGNEFILALSNYNVVTVDTFKPVVTPKVAMGFWFGIPIHVE